MLRQSNASTPMPSGPERLTKLSDLCSEAAGHVAKARLALDIEDFDADQALAHLDDAIGCLRRIVSHSKTGREPAMVHKLRSA